MVTPAFPCEQATTKKSIVFQEDSNWPQSHYHDWMLQTSDEEQKLRNITFYKETQWALLSGSHRGIDCCMSPGKLNGNINPDIHRKSSCILQNLLKLHSNCSKPFYSIQPLWVWFWKEHHKRKGKWQTDSYDHLCASVSLVTGYVALFAKTCTKP